MASTTIIQGWISTPEGYAGDPDAIGEFIPGAYPNDHPQPIRTRVQGEP